MAECGCEGCKGHIVEDKRKWEKGVFSKAAVHAFNHGMYLSEKWVKGENWNAINRI